MHKGISVWLDVPLEALVKRISAVGTDSRPLLHHDSTDAYAKVGFSMLFSLDSKVSFVRLFLENNTEKRKLEVLLC